VTYSRREIHMKPKPEPIYNEEDAVEVRQRVRTEFYSSLQEHIHNCHMVGRLLDAIPNEVFQHADVTPWHDGVTMDVLSPEAYEHVRGLLGKSAYPTEPARPFAHHYIRHDYILSSIPIETTPGTEDKYTIQDRLEEAGVDWTTLHIDVNRPNCRRVEVGTQPVYEYICP
jgi:hypothetical protein